MFQTRKKLINALVLLLVIFTTVAGQGSGTAYAAPQTQSGPAAPLAPGYTWNDLGQTTRSITLNAKGDSISLAGETFQAAETFTGDLPQEMTAFYSNEQLFNNGGWTSDNAFETPEGLHQVFYHDSGVYLAVDFVACADDASAKCVTVWKSELATSAAIVAGSDQAAPTSDPNATTNASTFSKTSPTDASTITASTTVKLTWGSYLPTPDKYSYCIKAGSKCSDNDPNWTGTLTNTSVNVSLTGGLKYYWQVKAITCVNCTPKTIVYANTGVWWSFNTISNTISGNAGVAGATLTYVDSGTKTVISDAAGKYIISPSYNWSGSVTPSKTGYTFSPVSRPFSNVKTVLVDQNFAAIPNTQTISGNVGAAGVTLSYTNGTPMTVMSDGAGAYSFTVPFGWSGTVTPTKNCFNFVPSNIIYSNIQSNQINQNYSVSTSLPIISGNAGVGSVTLSYTDGSPLSVQSLANGDYLITVSCSWSGTVTPSMAGFSFRPANLSYINVVSNKINQNFTPLVTITGSAGAGTTISYVDNGIQTVTADGSGNYTMTVPYGWSGTLTPSKLNTIFNPTSITLANVSSNKSAQDFTPSAGVSISGNVGIGGVALSFTDGTAQIGYSASDGSYLISVASGWTGTVTPSKTGYTFNPADRSYNNQTSSVSAEDYQIVLRGASTVGVFRPSNGILFLRNTNTSGVADISINYGLAGDKPITGDWNGDGTDTIGVYRNGTFYLRNQNSLGTADVSFAFGSAGDQPISGDWNGDGIDTIGVYHSATATFYLRDSNDAGSADYTFVLGNPGDVAIAGDWTGTGSDTTGVFRPTNGALYLKNTNTTGVADITINYGLAGDKPVVGDWNNDGTDTIGVFRAGQFYLRNSNTIGVAELTIVLGLPTDLPIAGNWDGQP